MYKIISLLLFLFVSIVSARADLPLSLKVLEAEKDPPAAKPPKVDYRIPNIIKVDEYDLLLDTYLEEENPTSKKNFTFHGSVTIKFSLTKETNEIIFHSDNLTNLQIKKLESGSVEIKDCSFVLNREGFSLKNFTALKCDNSFKVGPYTVKIDYDGDLSNDMRGFYKSSYKNDQNEIKWLATTHLEPIAARRILPCFDEPEYKAVFNVKIKHHKKYNAISNTKVAKTENDKDDRVITSFEKTPKMSTYLLAFLISDFKNNSNKENNFTVYARPNYIQHSNLAKDKGEEILKKLEEFTQVPFSTKMKKMDQAAIPDFAPGAMENWGLVLYREKSLLYNEKTDTTSEKQNIIETIAHEFAHQWFGNLVSPKWWKFLWLNEGFANFFQSFITEKVETTWRSVEHQVVSSIQTSAFDVDCESKTHPINNEVNSPQEISNAFDQITYKKGGAVIRMMQHFLTTDIFQKGLNNYLTKYTENSADSDNLFQAIQEEVDKEKSKNQTSLNLDHKVKAIMDTWVNQKGYPVVNVKRDYKAKKIDVSQEIFTNYNASEEEKKQIWYIPINWASKSNLNFKNTVPDEWLNVSQKLINVVEGENDWIILNKQQTGFYRVNYDEQNWNLITDYLNSENRTNVHPLNRAQLINDALAFTKQNKLNLTTLTRLVAGYKNDTDFIAWYPTFRTISWLNNKLINTKHYEDLKKFVLDTNKKLIETVGLEGKPEDDHLTKLNRINAVPQACFFGHEECLKKMHEKLVAWLNNSQTVMNTNEVKPDLKQIVLCYGLQKANDNEWTKVFNKTIDTNTDSKEKDDLVVSLACSADKNILIKYLNYTISKDSKIDTLKVVKSIRDKSPVGVDVILDFVINKFTHIYRKCKNNDQTTVQFMNEIGEKITNEVQLKKLKDSLQNLPSDLISESISIASNNIKWLENNEKSLAQWKKESKANSVGEFTGSFGLITLLLVISYFNIQ